MDFSNLGIEAMPAITVLCFVLAQILKAVGIKSDYIPPACAVMGIAGGIAAMYIMPGFPADNVITAAAVGALSGWAATGVHQTYKKLTNTK